MNTELLRATDFERLQFNGMLHEEEFIGARTTGDEIGSHATHFVKTIMRHMSRSPCSGTSLAFRRGVWQSNRFHSSLEPTQVRHH
jgi:hypothetical protein